ncbi:hypothetical protein COW98_01865 [Candidatus Roizmanbacteria bacterium CG22_combo_CG10-13_8_21_14_all_35_9]|uniref:Uncharacterized protein n=4 Tax=Candidatus Roizmaniibacteriota TaxID=1752723 RepID=A0A2M8F383_9BACT|nr:hypothetical protein [Candidatus Roizmanbacteria bacterium]PIP14985.1 MAG: hypothetical protein COX47_02145 [Candidatus Roizmanbacteria bacterium CG23_combo_of_CG06-09_8_20_14_all_35_49]PIP62839.1 MAG: hypothetical protein COW98_01865 [Candidatus Roizmanbacteria bacterium CG22_combo_CG10-13_8_21_14_all_35_9]PIY71311.1 MAG: hypothetical protein COY88_01035 [Candidatus Roizmanbacteria bacterium CG_4_10_14_0_8_um_filter_35_28]PJC33700.1 MAG: hypothetical protein CO048_02525 [Candidatus Roizmanb
MLTKDDRKFITELLDERFKKNNEVLVKEMVELFNTTNERIDDTNERIDKVLDQLKDRNDFLDTHERRIEKLEEKVFPVA